MIKTWHIEITVIALVLAVINLLFANNLVNWITTVAILLSFNHGQIGDRLQEQQTVMTVKTVECYHKLNKLFGAKEIVWIVAFLLMKNYVAIAGSFLFFYTLFGGNFTEKK